MTVPRIKHRCDVFKIAGMCGVRILRPDQRRPGPMRPRDCFARKTLKKIGQKNGEGHLALVIRLIIETRGNATELYSETLQAISHLLVQHPELVERGGALFEEFDQISLADLRRRAKGLAIGIPVSHVMRVMLALQLLRPDADLFDIAERERVA